MLTNEEKVLVRETYKQIKPLSDQASAIFYARLFEIEPQIKILFDELVEKEHGKIGTDSRNEYEEGAQMFIVSEMLKEARLAANVRKEVEGNSEGSTFGVGQH